MKSKQISILGQNIKKIREAQSTSAYKLAKDAHVGTSTISQIESGERQNLNTETLTKIAEALGVKAEDLLFSTDGEYVVSDLEEAFQVVLSSEELSLDGIEIKEYEKELIERYIKKALKTIRDERNDLK
ncbi:helix-turn-helix domain-containing protein [Clostridium hydrogenum]|uniref:helix-turn-helix domain-containing protein n=1 Tax=Clostridium hydrogenum TaxID=2855764 RepID=UPI001F193516|nr:helix-turn-helix transcriptional regulator [Clostridium hydrogenum]